jgi:hypothetical protein
MSFWADWEMREATMSFAFQVEAEGMETPAQEVLPC